MSEKEYIVYTDGSYKDSTKSGGWSSIILDKNNNCVELYSGLKYTSSNRMELMAVLETLKYFKEPSKIKIISDSMYVVNSITQHWAEKWFENKDYSKENLDLWIQVLELLKVHKVEVEWVKGHACSKWNNRADELAQFAATFINLPKDEYYLKSKKDR